MIETNKNWGIIRNQLTISCQIVANEIIVLSDLIKAIAHPKFIESFEFSIKHFLDFNTCTKDQHKCVYMFEILRFD